VVDKYGNPVINANNLSDGTLMLSLSDQNIVNLGSTIQVLPPGSGLPITLSPLLDGAGNPHQDGSLQLYVEMSDAKRQIVELVNNNILPYLDSGGNPIYVTQPLNAAGLLVLGRNIDATGSGVIGAGTVTLDASGSIAGNIFALNNVNINAVNNVNVSVLGLGNVSVSSAAGSISGTIIGVGGVSASGSSIDANLESNGSVSGSTSGEKGMASGTAADATATAASASDDSAKATKQSSTADDTEDPMKKKKGIALAQKVSRVTVLLPAKN